MKIRTYLEHPNSRMWDQWGLPTFPEAREYYAEDIRPQGISLSDRWHILHVCHVSFERVAAS